MTPEVADKNAKIAVEVFLSGEKAGQQLVYQITDAEGVLAAETKTGIDEKEAAAYTAGKKETAEQMQTTEMELGSLYFLKLEDYEKSRRRMHR